jgi:hypothetical protein
MLNHPALIDQLARQRTAELHAAAWRERLAGRTARLLRMRVFAARMLIKVGTRLAPAETGASNRLTKLAGR